MAVFQRADGTTFEVNRGDPAYARSHAEFSRIDRPVHAEPRDPALDAALRDDFDATAAIYCDWLLERGHPRGELGTRVPPAERDAFARAHGLLASRNLSVTWDRGFARAVEIEDEGSVAESLDDLFEVLHGPSFRALASLGQGIADFRLSPGLNRVLVDCESPPPLTSLDIGPEGGSNDDLFGLSARYPRLEHLWFSARRCEPLDLPRLRSLGAACSDVSLASSRLPAVEELKMMDSEVAAQMIERGAVPALRSVVIPRQRGHRLVDALARSATGARLEHVIVAMHPSDAASWEAFLASVNAFPRLTMIVMHSLDRAPQWTSQLERTGWRFEDGRPYVWRRIA